MLVGKFILIYIYLYILHFQDKNEVLGTQRLIQQTSRILILLKKYGNTPLKPP